MTDTASTGWETFLDAVIRAGFVITGTWPMRTEMGNRMIGSGTNALASSIVLVVSPASGRLHQHVSRREFIRELNAALPEALDEMTRGGVNSPVAPGGPVPSHHWSRDGDLLEVQGRTRGGRYVP